MEFQTTCDITFEFIPYNEYEITFSEFIMTRLRAEQPENCGSNPSKGKRISCTWPSPDRLLGPLIVYWAIFPWG